MPGIAREVRSWRYRALAIPDATTRSDALTTLYSKRFNIEGAGLFAILPRRRDPHLLRLLVIWQILIDFLDDVSERSSPDPIANSHQLHLALMDALDSGRCLSDYYLYHPWKNDGGYLRALVRACRRECNSLPSYHGVQRQVVQSASRFCIQTFNHDPDIYRRSKALKSWAAGEFSYGDECWWELTAAASSSLGMYALLALAADPQCSEQDITRIEAAYMPWICAAGTMLDSYVDHATDIQDDAHSYFTYYSDRDTGTQRIGELISQAGQEACSLRDGHKHATIVAGMIAMYLSEDSARTPELQTTTQSLIVAGGSLTRLLLPILRAWRLVYAQRSA
jgi:tetraprenyl-beta-curcumene synthase